MEDNYKLPPLPDRNKEEEVVDSFMEGSIRASRLNELCDALRLRIRALREEVHMTSPSSARDSLEVRIKEARRQLGILRQEQAISQFVEDSVRATLRNETVEEDFEDEFS